MRELRSEVKNAPRSLAAGGAERHREDDRNIVSQEEWERGCKAFAAVLCVGWGVMLALAAMAGAL